MLKNIIVTLIIGFLNINIFGNTHSTKQGDLFANNTSGDESMYKNVSNNIIETKGKSEEPYIDINNNGEYDYAEEYIDYNQNARWDNAESFQDLNQNAICDKEEPFIDKGNDKYDEGEEFIDINNNNVHDIELWYIDNNKNGQWDEGEPFEDLNNDGIRGYKEPFTDLNNNNKYDVSEQMGDTKFSFSAVSFSEPFDDIPSGKYDLGEEFEDLDGDGVWTPAEEFEDLDGDGKWSDTINKIDNSITIDMDKPEEELPVVDTLISTKNDFIINDPNSALASISTENISFKSPGKALLFSGVLPGMGQLYMNSWVKGLVFAALDGIAIGTWHHNNKLAEEKKNEYVNYASEHWNFGTWIHDYYKWYNYDDVNPDSDWNDIREVFINYSDSTSGCADDPTLEQCYVDIWENSHSVEFTWDDEIISSNYITSSSSDIIDFKDVFNSLCGSNSHAYKTCDKDSLSIVEIMEEHSVFVIRDHHFFEGIQKYDMYFSGWDDNSSVTVVTKPHGDKNATSPNQSTYRKLWNDYDYIKRLAGNAGKFMFIDRAVSMLDAVLLAKKWNNTHNVKLSLNAYPDLRNKSGLGGVKLSFHFR